jgi:DNA-binding transcriptional MerR regulator
MPAAVSFTDGKADDAMRTIGEVAAALGIRQHILRYWEQQFPMLKPLKRSGGRRLYRPEDLALVVTIDRLVNREGYTLKGARAVIEGGSMAAPAVGPQFPAGGAPDAPATSTQTSMTEIRERLAAIRDRLSGALRAA